MVFIESQDTIPHPLCQNAPKSTPVNEPSADSDTKSCKNIDCMDECQPPPEVEGGETHADALSDNEQTFPEPQNVPTALPSPPEVLTPQNAPLGIDPGDHHVNPSCQQVVPHCMVLHIPAAWTRYKRKYVQVKHTPKHGGNYQQVPKWRSMQCSAEIQIVP